MTTASKFQQAVALHQRGELAQAESLYRTVLSQAPDHFDALHLFGVLQTQLGRHDEAVAAIREAIAVNPGNAAAHSNLGLALHQQGQFDEALASFDRALAIRPDHAATLYNRGNALRALKRAADAVVSYDRAVGQNPDLADAWLNRGNALRELGLSAEALSSYERALALKRDDADVLFNRGNVLLELGRPAEALQCYDSALRYRSDDIDVLFHRGNALARLERREEAVASYDQALRLRVGHVEALNNRGIVLADLDRHDEALASFERALAIEPESIAALNNRANTLQKIQRYADAAASLARLVELAPDYEYAQGRLVECRLHCCDWTDFAQDAARLERAVAEGGRRIAPFAFLAVSHSAALQLECARIFVADKAPPSATTLWTGERYGHDRIRLAYLSADFREHPLTHLMMELFERHDRTQFDIMAISSGDRTPSPVRSRLERAFERFIDIREESDADAAALLRRLEVDIVVDLNGFTAGGRTGVLALRPAPIQVSYLGFPGTMGAAYVDYIFADRFVIPESYRRHYAENVVYLPDTFQANDSGRQPDAPTPSRDEVGLPLDGFVFCSFNTNYKITPAMFDVWMRLLRRIDRSVLWLQRGNPAVETNLRREAQARGVDPGRLVFAPRTTFAEHMARSRLADLFLDTLPFNAGTTASDALAAGLPILTCSGEALAARMAGSVLHAIGLPELVTHSLAEYEAQAYRLATEPATQSDLKQRLARNRDSFPLFDGDRFRRHVEAAYRAMWERFERGEAAAPLAVAPSV